MKYAQYDYIPGGREAEDFVPPKGMDYIPGPLLEQMKAEHQAKIDKSRAESLKAQEDLVVEAKIARDDALDKLKVTMQDLPKKKKGGRPKGSKNKPKIQEAAD